MKHDPWSRRRSIYSTPATPKKQVKPKRRWMLFRVLWGALKKTCTVLGAVILFSAFMFSWSASSVMENERVTTLPDEMVLFLELDGKLADLPADVSLTDPFASHGMTVKDFIDGLDRAKDDTRVKGIYANMVSGSYALGHIQEIRAAIKRFRDSGKFAYVFSSSYADAGGMGTYYLASAFEQIWLQPMGVVAITGVSTEMPFVRGALDKIGVEPQFFQRKEYKTAYESFTNSEMSEANREMTGRLILDIAHSLQEDIVADRPALKANFKELVDHGLFIEKEAKAAGLVDEIAYADVLVRKVNEKVTGNADDEDLAYVHIEDYVRSGQKKKSVFEEALASSEIAANDGRPQIALIYAVGAIMSSDSEAQSMASFVDDGIAAADDIAPALLRAAKDENIEAVVLRIDSPGGSPVASETILRAVEKVQEKGKKVIVSMGPTAASGGYWIAAYADQIFVLPTTLTGSIGVLGGKVSAKGVWENLGINWDSVKWGKNSGIWSMNTPFSETEAERMNAMLDNIYDNFLDRVAKGRKMNVEDVDKIARGRVWTGKRAIELGLADQIGGLNEALDYTAQMIGEADRHAVNVVILPEPLSPFEEFIQMLEQQVRAGEIAGIQAAVMKEFMPLVRQAVIAKNPQDYAVYNSIEVK